MSSVIPSPALPLEVLEHITDWIGKWPTHVYNMERNEFVWSESRDATLLACALTCHAWYFRSRLNLLRSIRFPSRERLAKFTAFLAAKPHFGEYVASIYIENELGSNSHKAVPPVAPFPLMLARYLPQLGFLQFKLSTFPLVHNSFYLGLSEFTSLVHLSVRSINFRSVEDFGRLAFGFPNLQILSCTNIQWTKNRFDPLVIRRHGPHTHLTDLHVMGLPASIADIFRVFVDATAGASLRDIKLYTSVPLQDMETIGLGRLWQAAGASLRLVEFGVFANVNLDAEKLKNTVEQHLSLAQNVNLTSLTMGLMVGNDPDYSWLPVFLSQITSREFHEIIFNVWIPPQFHGDPNIEGIIQRVLDLIHCNLIEETLSLTKFAKLQSVTFKIPRTTEVWKWDEALLTRLPKLHTRNILHCSA
ncbi:hypothetical protein BKA93DRAFT_749313 [Sparassis latifolia]